MYTQPSWSRTYPELEHEAVILTHFLYEPAKILSGRSTASLYRNGLRGVDIVHESRDYSSQITYTAEIVKPTANIMQPRSAAFTRRLP